MAENTKIEWADSTLNFWLGCTKVSNGPKGACEGCYAQVLVEERFGRAAWGPHAERIETKGWRSQLNRISKLAKAAGRPWFVFVNSLSDFWDNQADPALRRAAFEAMREHPHVTFLLLTKRPQNIVKLYDEAQPDHPWDFPKNVALGCTIVTQPEADRDLPWLTAAARQFKPAFTFVSMEPLMEAVNLTPWLKTRLINWVITGGETDQGKHRARPTETEWYRSLRDQCQAAGVTFNMKQMTRKAPIPADLQIQDRPSL